MSKSPQSDQIEKAIRDVLGDDRVRSVCSRFSTNEDGMKIARVLVVYDASRGLQLSEIDKIMSLSWPDASSEAMATPIFDFQEDTDNEAFAAE